MAKFNKKLSPLVNRQLPQHIQANNPLLAEFLKQYYVYMESAQITLSSVTASDQILLETASEGFLALDGTDEKGNNENDYLLNEEGSVGEFTKGETITGSTSGQTATILAEDTDNLKIYIPNFFHFQKTHNPSVLYQTNTQHLHLTHLRSCRTQQLVLKEE